MKRSPGHSIYHKTRELKSFPPGAETANHPLQIHSQHTVYQMPHFIEQY